LALVGVVVRSLYISWSATLLASLWSIPLSYYIAVGGRLRLLAMIAEALVGVPTVLVGLILYLLLSRSGPLGGLGILYTPYGIIIGEAILVTPLIIGTLYRVLEYLVKTYGELALSLGATPGQSMRMAIVEGLPSILSSLVMAFSRAIGELGVALMVGGNIKGYTRTMTTAIALDVSMGEFGEALSLGLILLILTIGVSTIARSWGRMLDQG